MISKNMKYLFHISVYINLYKFIIKLKDAQTIKQTWEKLKKIQINGEIYHAHDLLLLCCQVSPNWWIDLVQSQTKSQESFL